MKKIIEQILKIAVNAPSGDNSQPWRFKVINNRIFVYNLPKSDNPILNINQSGSYVAHGALLENIKICASSHSLEAKINISLDREEVDLVATVDLIKNDSLREDPLSRFVSVRRTNRRKYKNIALTEIQKKSIFSEAKKINNSDKIRLILIENNGLKKRIGQALSSIESIILQHKELHSLLFKDIIWSALEFKKLRSGFFIGTMEFNLMQKFIFYLASSWSRIKFLNKLGLANIVAKEDAKLYSSGAAIGAISIDLDTKENFIYVGMMMERIWIMVNSWGLSFHPVCAINFARLRIEKGVETVFNEVQTRKILDNYQNLAEMFDIKSGLIVMSFRMGQAPKPKYIALKRSPLIEYY